MGKFKDSLEQVFASNFINMKNSNAKPILGSIHGRFQPFHNAHLEYAREAYSKCDFLYVGLTRILSEQGPEKENAPHRYDPINNPFNYFQRAKLISAAFEEAGFPNQSYLIGPFPLENTDRLSEFFPKNGICFTTIKEDWNKRKISTLKQAGYSVQVIERNWYGPEFKNGIGIRKLMFSGNSAWKNFVPAATINLLESYINNHNEKILLNQ